MTEDEAKTKWCPAAQSRVVPWQSDAETLTNAVYGNPPTTNCVGSACMAWRVQTQTVLGYDPHGEMEARPPEFVGYCGLGGPPQ